MDRYMEEMNGRMHVIRCAILVLSYTLDPRLRSKFIKDLRKLSDPEHLESEIKDSEYYKEGARAEIDFQLTSLT